MRRFADALRDLPVSRLSDTVTEIRNSRIHLVRSNHELSKYADLGDEDCKIAISENQEVLERISERLDALRTEFEARGLVWQEDYDIRQGGTTERSTRNHAKEALVSPQHERNSSLDQPETRDEPQGNQASDPGEDEHIEGIDL